MLQVCGVMNTVLLKEECFGEGHFQVSGEFLDNEFPIQVPHFCVCVCCIVEPAAPVAIGVELIGDDWVLNWTLPKYRTVPITSEFRYWSTTSPVSVCVCSDKFFTS